VPPGHFLKHALVAPLRIAGVSEVLAQATATHASIFMLHRFSSPEDGVQGHDPKTVRDILSFLRRRRYDLISLQELFRRVRECEPLRRAVAFTIDDGYFDHGSVAGPIFAALDCPVTIFAVTGFLDGKIWLWWDQIQHICETTSRKILTAKVGNEERAYTLDSVQARLTAAHDISWWCQDASHPDRENCIATLSREADIELPPTPPRKFGPLSWDEARQLERRGVTFAPHTVTHPVLSSVSDEHAQSEISLSWKRVCQELAYPVPVFCYPHGRQRDFGAREMEAVQVAGLWGAVRGYAGRFREDEFRVPPAICCVPRFSFQDDLTDVLQCVSGLETIKARLRGAGA
jgi:peptidoglycan/xylan/chitin deacetylase (PgdA/CDA1 family)